MAALCFTLFLLNLIFFFFLFVHTKRSLRLDVSFLQPTVIFIIIISGIEKKREARRGRHENRARQLLSEIQHALQKERRIIIHSNYNHNLWWMKSAENLHTYKKESFSWSLKLSIYKMTAKEMCLQQDQPFALEIFCDRLAMKVSLNCDSASSLSFLFFVVL